MGWTAALGAFFTAYIRAMGGSLGLAHDFCGPMAKPQRMAVLTIALLLAAAERLLWDSQHSLMVAAILILAGLVLTCVRRTVRIARLLHQAEA